MKHMGRGIASVGLSAACVLISAITHDGVGPLTGLCVGLFIIWWGALLHG